MLTVCVCASACYSQIAFPSPDIIGKPAKNLQNWMFVPENAAYPDSIRFDLKNGNIVGIVCNYKPSAAEYIGSKNELQHFLGVEPRETNGAHTIWRLEGKKCVVTLTTFNDEKQGLTIIIQQFSL